MKNLIKNLSNTILHGASLKTDTLTSEERAIAYGVCRWSIQLDQHIQSLLHKPLKPKDRIILIYLYIGVFQLQHSDTPDYAIINTLVSQIKKTPQRWASGLVNKLLRTVAKQKEPTQSDALSVSTSHPQWVIDQLVEDYGLEIATDILQTNNERAPMTLRVNRQQTHRDSYLNLLKAQDIDATPCQTPSAIQLAHPIPVDQLPHFWDGFCSVQDESGQRIIEQMDIKPKMHVLDACSAPGSKTGHILEAEPSVVLTGCDIDAERLLRVRDNLNRLQLDQSRVSLKAADASQVQHWWDGKPLDRILIDAPCSGSGVIRRHPDIKLCRRVTDIDALVQRQLMLLTTLWPCLKPGGKLVYSTCSVFKAENEQVIAEFIKTEKTATLLFEQQWWPQKEGGDGFYIATLRKN